MNETKNKEEIKKAIENFRSTHFDDIPQELLSEILDVLSDTNDNAKAYDGIISKIREYLKK